MTEKAAATASERRGWGWPAFARKAHYFVNSQALCKGWLFMGRMEDFNHDSKDNCARCQKLRAALEKTA